MKLLVLARTILAITAISSFAAAAALGFTVINYQDNEEAEELKISESQLLEKYGAVLKEKMSPKASH